MGKDRKHKDHYDVTNPKTGKKLKGLIIMVTKYRHMDLKIKQKIMQHPHKSNGGECNRLITNKKQNI